MMKNNFSQAKATLHMKVLFGDIDREVLGGYFLQGL
jgi:hypothetical protein